MSVINTNITSMIGQQNLSKSQSALTTSMERLSSGLRINSAKDDAAGQAIANRMTAQINGLGQAQRNANDGISIAQTTEGGLNQINDNLQRVRELTVQAANGTNSQNDLQSIQDEVNQRLNEINRISEETDFNGTRVLSETASPLTIQVGAEDGQTIDVNIKTTNANSLGLADFDVRKAQPVEVETVAAVGGDVTPVEDAADFDITTATGADGTAQGVFDDGNGNYFVQITGNSDPAKDGFYAATIDNTDGTVTTTGTAPDTTPVGNTDIDLEAAGFSATATYDVVEDDNGDYFVDVTDSTTSGNDGVYAATIADDGTVSFDGTPTAGSTDTAVGIPTTVTDITTAASQFTAVTEVAGPGANTPSFATDAVTAGIDTPELVQLTTEDGAEVYAIQDANGDRFAADVDETTGLVTAQSVTYTDEAGAEQTTAVQLGGIDGVTGYVAVTNAEGNTTNYSSTALDGEDLQTAENVEQVSLAKTTDPLAQLDDALKQVDSLRSELGAVQNRFESAIENLSTNETNLSSARSRIEDADYATEVANMTRAQILQQAGTSVLAQANQIPQNVLSLLG